MTKTYTATTAYYLKIIMSICIILVVYAFYDFIFLMLFRFLKIDPSGIIFIITSVLLFIIAGFLMFLILRSNKPVITLDKDRILYRKKEILCHNIASFTPSKGGSEPFIQTKENQRIDLELSWLKQKDREEIEQFIQSKITHE